MNLNEFIILFWNWWKKHSFELVILLFAVILLARTANIVSTEVDKCNVQYQTWIKEYCPLYSDEYRPFVVYNNTGIGFNISGVEVKNES